MGREHYRRRIFKRKGSAGTLNYPIKEDIANYVKNGGRDAFAFSLTHTPKYDKIPGQMIQLMIDAELLKTKETVIW